MTIADEFGIIRPIPSEEFLVTVISSISISTCARSLEQIAEEFPGQENLADRVPDKHLTPRRVHLDAADFERLLHRGDDFLGVLHGHALRNRDGGAYDRIHFRPMLRGIADYQSGPLIHRFHQRVGHGFQ